MEIKASVVKELRERTGAGMMDCKKALTEAGGDADKAVEILRKKGIAAAERRSGRDASEGVIETYVHHDRRKACMVEINCETDFVARTDEFQAFAKDVALHVVAKRPLYVTSAEVPADVLQKERSILAEQAKASGKPEAVVDKMVEGRIRKFYEDVCLLDQVFVKDDSKTIGDLVKELGGKLGENIQVKRFALFEVGAV